MRQISIVLFFIGLMIPAAVHAADAGSDPAAGREVINLWPAGEMPHAIAVDFEEVNRGGSVSGVSVPQLIYCPSANRNTDATVLVVAGGGYSNIALQHEGFNTADYLNERGIDCFVLKYRHRPYRQPAPLADAQRAMRLIRMNAGKYGINPRKIGIIGYSAGGHLAASCSTMFDEKVYDREDDREVSARPDFSILVYPVITMGPETHGGSRDNLLGPEPDAALIEKYSCQNRVTDRTPPTILFHCSDDDVVPVANSLLYYQQLIAHGVDAEMHIYNLGGHGFGIPGRTDRTVQYWTEALDHWGDYVGRFILGR